MLFFFLIFCVEFVLFILKMKFNVIGMFELLILMKIDEIKIKICVRFFYFY